MLITRSTIDALRVGFKVAYNEGFEGAASVYKQLAMVVPSQTREEVYPWLGQFPGMREWFGPRVLNNLTLHDFTIKNRDFESTISVQRNDIEDDRIGVFGPMFQELGKSAAEHPDRLIFQLLGAGFATECYDGQNFFDAEHPVGDEAASGVVSVSNMQDGEGAPWFLLDTSRAIKPMIYQERRKYELVSKDNPSDDNVFMEKEYIYGVDGRSNAGFGLWQLAFGSKATLTATNYAAARSAMMSLMGDEGRPLGVRPDTLIVPPSHESAGLKLVNSEFANGGETNEWKSTAKLIVTPWLV